VLITVRAPSRLQSDGGEQVVRMLSGTSSSSNMNRRITANEDDEEHAVDTAMNAKVREFLSAQGTKMLDLVRTSYGGVCRLYDANRKSIISNEAQFVLALKRNGGAALLETYVEDASSNTSTTSKCKGKAAKGKGKSKAASIKISLERLRQLKVPCVRLICDDSDCAFRKSQTKASYQVAAQWSHISTFDKHFTQYHSTKGNALQSGASERTSITGYFLLGAAAAEKARSERAARPDVRGARGGDGGGGCGGGKDDADDDDDDDDDDDGLVGDGGESGVGEAYADNDDDDDDGTACADGDVGDDVDRDNARTDDVVHEKKAVVVKDDDSASCNDTASAKALSFRHEMHVTGGMYNAFLVDHHLKALQLSVPLRWRAIPLLTHSFFSLLQESRNLNLGGERNGGRARTGAEVYGARKATLLSPFKSPISTLNLLVVPLSFDDHFSTAAVIIPREGQTNGHILHFDTIVRNKQTQGRYHATEEVTALLGEFVARKLAEEWTNWRTSNSRSTSSSGSQQLCQFDSVIIDVPTQPQGSQVCGPATLLIIKRLVEKSDAQRLVTLSATSTLEKDLLRGTSQKDLLALCGLSNVSSSDYEGHRSHLRALYMQEQQSITSRVS
jgi:hypothetical protein